MPALRFKVLAKDRKTSARAGEITTAHGIIKTPAFIPVGTKASVKALNNFQLEEIGAQAFFVNTYHLYLQPGEESVKKLGGLHRFINWEKPLITDSGGFQVFSQARNNKFGGFRTKIDEEETLCRIDEGGVTFKSFKDGSTHRFTPEKSIEIQKKLGADIVLAFDECTHYPATYEYAKKAMERTHRWAVRCLKIPLGPKQSLLGIIQGSTFKDLREESAKYLANLPFSGLAIGGVSVGESKKQMVKVLDWVVPRLPEGKPRHLLGVGEVDDIFQLVERGIDSFDCVMPTRLGRMGQLLTKNPKEKKFSFQILKARYMEDKRPIEENCGCYACQNYSRAYLNHLFRSNELLAYSLATYHNLWFIERLMEEIRISIVKGTFLKLKKEWLNN